MERVEVEDLDQIEVLHTEISKNVDRPDCEHIVIDIGGVRIHCTHTKDKTTSITAHDSEHQSSILADDQDAITTVTYEGDITPVEREHGLTDLFAMRG